MYKITTYLHEDTALVAQNKTDTLTRWTEHHMWTRNAIISIIGNLADQPAVTERLMKNQVDIGDLLLPYYAQTDVDTLVTLLKAHAAIVAEAAKVPTITPELETRMNENNMQIANFLEYLNSYFWPKTKFVPLWDAHMKATLQEIKSRRSGLWAEDVVAADAAYANIKEIAQMFHSGLFYQNLEKFSKPAV